MDKITRLIGLIGLCCFYNTRAQTYDFRIYSEDQGLPHAYVYAISQTADGYLYLSTGEGLSVFDGTRFTTFSGREISNKMVGSHFIDARGINWIGHLQNGASYLKNGVFTELKLPALQQARVTGFAGDARGQVWIGTLGGGLFVVDSLFHVKQLALTGIDNINALRFNKDGNLLLATDNGLVSLLTTAGGAQVACRATDLLGKNVKRITMAKNLAWLAVEGEGLYALKNNNGCFETVLHILPELASQDNMVADIYSDRAGNLWVSLFGEGLRKIVFTGRVEDKAFSVFKIDKSNGLANLYVQCVFEDFEGNMWFGTFGGGLVEMPVEKFSFYNLKNAGNADVKKIAVDNYNNLWLALPAGLTRFSPQSDSLVTYNEIKDEITALYVDHSGLLWIGTATDGIYTYDPALKTFSHFSKEQKLVVEQVNAFFERGNEMVIATTNGIFIYNLRFGDMQFYTTDDGLLHNHLVSVFYDSKHRLWISSHGAPPYYIANGKVKVFKEIKELGFFNINAVTEDRSGAIWIATEGDGLFRYDGKDFINYKMGQGLASNYCYGVAVDNNNSVWVTHKNGLSEKKSTETEFHTISSTEGLLFTENNLNAVARDAKGDLWFGTSSGLVHYNAGIGRQHATQPRLSILDVKLNNRSYNVNDNIEVPYNFYSVHIGFIAISLTNPENVKYKYRLAGLDSGWHYTNQRFVDYPNLDDGDYVFELYACNGEGVWTTTPATVSFTIREPIWKKAWFYALLVAGLTVLVYVIILWRTQSLKRSQQLLKVKVKQKTYLLQREKEAVEKIKTELEEKNKDILDSITYARRIQDSLLPPDDLLRELFDENYFILYKPKDIVSGDFYWASRVNAGTDGELALAAVADCTGHGVPGAFLSIVASSFLKQALAEKFVTNTGQVLDYLNRNITETLNQSKKARTRVNDGMDLALVAIDYRHKRLYYSGANNAIYIFRKQPSAGEPFILKPTKQAIGSAWVKGSAYDTQVFDLQPGDTVYMFSDGFADQFGGDRDKKLNYKRFRDMLAAAVQMPVSQQCAYLEQCFEDWKGSTPQTDDVCVMGLRF